MLHAADECPVERGHEPVDGPLLIEVAADDDGAAERDDEAQQRQRRVAFHAGDDAECLLHCLMFMFTSFYISTTVPKNENADSVRDNKISERQPVCVSARGCAELHIVPLIGTQFGLPALGNSHLTRCRGYEGLYGGSVEHPLSPDLYQYWPTVPLTPA